MDPRASPPHNVQLYSQLYMELSVSVALTLGKYTASTVLIRHVPSVYFMFFRGTVHART